MNDSDPLRRARELARAREAVLGGDTAERPPRPVVAASWERSLAARVDPEAGLPSVVYEPAEIRRMRDVHPLCAVLPLLRDTLVSIADEAMHMMIVTDAQGHILWREGQRDVLSKADTIGLVEGARWTEESAGTNAMGTALAADRAVRIHSAEHLVRSLHRWTCAAAPIHDPDTGDLIGAVDVTGPARTFHPTTLCLVTAAARLAENLLATRLAMREESLRIRNLPHLTGLRDEPGALLTPSGRVLAAQPAGWLPDRIALPSEGDRVHLGEHGEGLLEPLPEGWLLRLRRHDGPARSTVGLSFLGAERPVAHLDGATLRLTRRHADLLTVLALHPQGRTADQLATDLYGDTGKTVTVRAEMHRLRGVLGACVLRTQPYRLDASLDADFLDVRTDLDAGRVREAVRGYRGPLLPRSEAPAVRAERDLLAATVRRAVLASGDTATLWTLAAGPGGADDPELAERLLRALPRGDPRRPGVAARLAACR